jgi:hypothetical protein
LLCCPTAAEQSDLERTHATHLGTQRATHERSNGHDFDPPIRRHGSGEGVVG